MTDDDDFAAFMAEALPGLLRFGHVLTGDAHAAEELVQDSLVRTCARWRRLRRDQPAAYVRRVMVNAWTSRWRRLHREQPLPEQWDPPVAGGEAGWDERDRTLAALRLLPPRQRAVVVLRYYEDLTEAQIADVLGCSPGTVKSQASRALRTLHAALAEPALIDDRGALR